jgi:WD40 repeat protein/serine/threonine protein kinase/two-component SAPR family response regulator
MARLSVSLLGTFRVTLDGQPVTSFEYDKVRALLAYLAVESQQAHRRETLAGLLWPKQPERTARHSLSQALSNLRRAIGDREAARTQGAGSKFLLTDHWTIQFNPSSDHDLDVATFKGLLGACEQHQHRELKACESCSERLGKAVALYQGSFLEGFSLPDSPAFEEWTILNRERLHRLVMEALHRLACYHEQHGEYETGLQHAWRQVELDPWWESAHRQAMRLLALSGQRGAALRQYRECVRVLDEELGVAPAAETTELYERIQAEGMPELDEEAGKVSVLRTLRGYELRECISAGGFGEVYRAYQPSVAREVAIKVILPKYANHPDFVRRFETEAQLVARLEHLHIVPLYDYWREPGGAYLVMRWLRGGNLHQSLQRGPWTPDAAARLLDQIASALAIAHRQGVVHRDVKPENILLDKEGNAYLTDFGFAKDLLLSTGTTATDTAVSSLAYISPEQARGQPVSPQSDIYSLGIVLYEVLTGTHPFPGLTHTEQLVKRLTEPLPPLREQRPELPVTLEKVVQHATAQVPAERYANVLAFAAAFREAVFGLDPEAATVPPDRAVAKMVNPYKGLRPFEEADAADFFGREALVERLLARLSENGDASTPAGTSPSGQTWSRFLAVVGPSGSGKSSVVKAGLLPALRRGALPGSENWFIVEVLPGTHPLDELEIGLLRVAVTQPVGLMEQLRRDERGLLRATRLVLPIEGNDRRQSELLLVIDQLEELFTRAVDKAESEHLLQNLYAAVSDPRSRVRVVVTLRADFYDRPLMLPDFSQLMRERTEVVIPLTAEELAQAIREPAERAGAELETGLVTTIVADVNEQPGALPMMQYALTELFEHREGRLLTRQAYQAIGGVSGALARRAEEVYGGLDAAERAVARQLLLRLVEPGEGTEDTRRRVLRSELEALTMGQGPSTDDSAHGQPLPATGAPGHLSAMSKVIDVFGRHRLLTLDRDPATRTPTVKVAHDALLREWGRLREWLDASRADVRMQRLLTAAAEEWKAAHQEPSFLLRGTRLAGFEGWAESSAVALTQDEYAYLEASIAYRQEREAEAAIRQQRELETARKLAETEKSRAEEQSRAAQRLRRRAVFLAGALFVSGMLAIIAFALGRQATQERQVAERQARVALANQLAAQSLSLLDDQLDLALLLGVQAFDILDTVQTSSTLLSALQHSPGLIRLLSGHTGAVNSVAVSPDGTTLASGSQDGTIMLWDVETGPAIGTAHGRITGHADAVNGVAFSPDGSILASGSRDGTVILWDISTTYTLSEVAGLDTSLATGQPTSRTLTGHTGWVDSVAFSADGTILASGGCAILGDSGYGWEQGEWCFQGEIRLWDVQTGQAIGPAGGRLTGHAHTVHSLAFSPDGFTLASGSCGEFDLTWCSLGEILLWDISTALNSDPEASMSAGWAISRSLPGHVDTVTSVAFSPDGLTLASGSIDTAIRLWDVRTGQAVGQPLSGHAVSVESVAFSPDGSVLASGGGDKTVRLWDAATGKLIGQPLTGHTSPVISLSFGSDGTTLASGGGSPDNSIRLWFLGAEGSIGVRLATFPPRVIDVAFSPDGGILAAGGADSEVHLLDGASGRPNGAPLVGHAGPVVGAVIALAFSPDGHILASGSADNTIILWDVENRQPIGQPLTGHTDHVFDVAFSPDGATLASCAIDGTIRLWDVATGHSVGEPLTGHTDVVEAVAFSPDGKTLSSGSLDGSVRQWDVENHQPIGPAAGRIIYHPPGIESIALNPDGNILAAASSDGIIFLWDVEAQQLIDRLLTGHAGHGGNVAFSPDGATLAAGSTDGTISLWDLVTRRAIGQPLTGHTHWVLGIAFSPDGKNLASASFDGTVRMWDVDPESWNARVCQIAGRNLTRAEWEQYLPGEPYRETCPQWPVAD